MGKWNHPSPTSAVEIEQLLDKYKLYKWHKPEKVLVLDKLTDKLNEYVVAGQADSAAQNLLQKRLDQVAKKRLQYQNALAFVKKLKVEQILDNVYLKEGFEKFLTKESNVEGLQFLDAVGYCIGAQSL